MARLIDTSVLVELERRGHGISIFDTLAADEPIATASISVSELLVGAERADSTERKTKRLLFVEALLGRVRVLPFDLAAARVHARVWADLRTRGQSIGPHDLIIAATALTHDYEVITYNLRDFERVPGLIVHRPGW
jgi:predicted nucleic acid-binding protein